METAPLSGKVALITGAGRNIGRAIALALADAGAKMRIKVRASHDEGEAVVNEIAGRGVDAVLVMADVTRRAEVDAAIETVAQRWGRLDILVNNAAIRNEVAFADMPYAAWLATLDVCGDAAFRCRQAAVRLRRKSSAGTVANIGGLTAHTGAGRRAHVVTAKAALAGLTRAL